MPDSDGSTVPHEGERLNERGDRVITTTRNHGIDISSQRLDHLDRKALQFALSLHETADATFQENPPNAVDLGCGLGTQGVRLSLLGMATTLIDIHDISRRIEMLSELFEIGSLRFLQEDLRNLQPTEIPEEIALLYSQRFIHYLDYEEALTLLSLLADHTTAGGRVFISASGLETELGDGYPDRDAPVERRFSTLASPMAEKHDIHDPVCLYTIDDMERLLTVAGFQMHECTASTFGNIKAIAERPSSR